MDLKTQTMHVVNTSISCIMSYGCKVYGVISSQIRNDNDKPIGLDCISNTFIMPIILRLNIHIYFFEIYNILYIKQSKEK